MENRCNKCGKPEGTGVILINGLCMDCFYQQKQPTYSAFGMGWECPRCHKINAPWMSSCDCPPTYQYSYTTTTGPVTVCNEPPVQIPKTWEVYMSTGI